MTSFTLEISTFLDGEPLMDDVTFHMAVGSERHAKGSHRANEPACDNDLLGDHAAFELRVFPKQ